ncbi:MAG: hypothetical protein QNJ55_22775 [Xenococcus sp. MO_188.B8]|nr:hypothetical protein [Xenococcus sp. MO_188.B8]
MQQFMPLELIGYFLVFQCHFSKPNFVYFQGYLWGLLLGLQHFAISRVLSPKSASEADFPPQSPELDRILRLAS